MKPLFLKMQWEELKIESWGQIGVFVGLSVKKECLLCCLMTDEYWVETKKPIVLADSQIQNFQPSKALHAQFEIFSSLKICRKYIYIFIAI